MQSETDGERFARLREAMAATVSDVTGKVSPDRYDKEETAAAREAAAKVKALEEANTDLASFRELREKYAGWVFKYLVGYSIGCLALLVAHGAKLKEFSLPESVLTALVGSTAVSAIGLVLAVTHGLFKAPSGSGSK